MDIEKKGKIYEINESEKLDCLEKLKETQNVVESGVDKDALYLISTLLEECVEEAPGATISLFDSTLNKAETTAFPFDYERSALATLGSSDVQTTDIYMEKCMNEYDPQQLYYRSLYIPYLYQDIPEELIKHFEDWYDENQGFFEYTVKEVLGVIYRFHVSDEDADLVNHLPQIRDKLVNLAESEDVDVEDTLKAEGKENEIEEMLRQSRLVLEDLIVYPQYIDFRKVEENIETFPNLEAFMTPKETWLEQLRSKGDHPLSRMLTQYEDEYSSKKELEFLDYCCEVLDPKEQGTGSIRDNLLSRGDFSNAVVEIEVANALRREFGSSQVVLEEEIGGKCPDMKVSFDDSVIWVEATKPERSTSALLERVFGVSRGEDSDVRSTVTGKRSQIKDVSKASPDGLTGLVVKNDFSKIDDGLVQEYVLSEYSQQDQISDYLDILINYGYDGLGEGPYLAGQVFDLKNVDEEILERLGDAFNADVYGATDN